MDILILIALIIGWLFVEVWSMECTDDEEENSEEAENDDRIYR